MTDNIKTITELANLKPLETIGDIIHRLRVERDALTVELDNERRKVTELVDGYERDQSEIKALAAELTALRAQEPIGKLVVNQYSDSRIGIEFCIDKPEERLNVDAPLYLAAGAKEQA